MFHNFFIAVAKSRSRSAAMHVVATLSEQELQEMGHSRSSFVEAFIDNVTRPIEQGSQSLEAPVNANLFGAV